MASNFKQPLLNIKNVSSSLEKAVVYFLISFCQLSLALPIDLVPDPSLFYLSINSPLSNVREVIFLEG